MLNPTIEQTIWIAASPERTWRAITEPGQLDHWWGAPGLVQIAELDVGAAIVFHTSDGPISATIQQLEPPRRFVYAWPPHPRYFSVPFVSSYDLSEESSGTRATLTESGFAAWPDDAPRRERYQLLTNGFHKLLENLKTYLESESSSR